MPLVLQIDADRINLCRQRTFGFLYTSTNSRGFECNEGGVWRENQGGSGIRRGRWEERERRIKPYFSAKTIRTTIQEQWAGWAARL